MRRLSVMAISMMIFLSVALVSAAAPDQEWNFYFGNLHAHTSYSDGMGTPTEAYTQVSGPGGMDFFSTTEHGYYYQEITNIHLWYKSFEEADAFYIPGKFVSLVGYEWTHSEGHMNGYGTPKAASRDTQKNFTAFIEYLHTYGGIATFNHPNPEIQPNWNDFSYWSYADEVVSMIEVGSGAYYRNTRNEPSYIKALDRGWKIGAVNNQDNHRNDWGTAAEVRTGIVAKELTRESVMDAMRNMRTYSTEDRDVKALITSGGHMMGDTIIFGGAGKAEKFVIEVYADDPDGDAFKTVEIITNGGKVAAKAEFLKAGSHAFEVQPQLDYNYYYAKILESDGDTIITTPIWIETGSGIVASDFRMEDVFVSAGNPATFYARVADRNGTGDVKLPYELLADFGDGFTKVASGELAVESGRWSHLLVPWTPARSGRAELKLVLMASSGAQSFAAGAVEVLKVKPLGFAVDEGHNNRMTSYFGKLIGLAKQLGYEGKVNEDIITPAYLEGLKALIMPLPEQGFALKPTYYEESELAAIAGWVRGGGNLLLIGWSDTGDGSRDNKDFNALLAMLSADISLGADQVMFGEAAQGALDAELNGGSYKLILGDASSVKPAGGAKALIIAEGLKAVAPDGIAVEDPVIAASAASGRGNVLVIGSVPFSDYELGKAGYANADFTKAIIRWLFEGRW